MTILTRWPGNRGRGTWPDGEPESVRAAADAAAPKGRKIPDIDRGDSDPGLDRTINPLSIGGLTLLAGDLLRDATDLPRPGHVTVSQTGQRIALQFGSELGSHNSLIPWAIMFGSEVEFSRATRKGRRLVSVAFTYYGAAVEAYAYI